VKEGGAIILVASCEEGMGESIFEKWMLEMSSSPTSLKSDGTIMGNYLNDTGPGRKGISDAQDLKSRHGHQ
jgi:hypothetical protein